MFWHGKKEDLTGFSGKRERVRGEIDSKRVWELEKGMGIVRRLVFGTSQQHERF